MSCVLDQGPRRVTLGLDAESFAAGSCGAGAGAGLAQAITGKNSANVRMRVIIF
jgi:hypothetical protein